MSLEMTFFRPKYFRLFLKLPKIFLTWVFMAFLTHGNIEDAPDLFAKYKRTDPTVWCF